MKNRKLLLILTAALTLGIASAGAADLPSKKPPPKPAPVMAPVFEPWQIHIRGLGVIPTGSGHINQLPGYPVTAGHSIVPEVDISYYFTPNWAVEAICCVSYNSIYVKGLSGNVASTWLFPPTVTGQYHFTSFGAFQPYVGVGVNFTDYFNTKTYNALAGDTLHINPSWGVAAQVGFDYMIDSHWGINVDAKWLLAEPGFHVNDAYGVQTLTGRASVNPFLIGAGLTYRFGG